MGDTVVQQTIRSAFAASTIITIAHRLNTVIDFDKILVMDKGTVAEYDSPAALLENEDGLFTKLVNSTGASSAAELRHRAITASRKATEGGTCKFLSMEEADAAIDIETVNA